MDGFTADENAQAGFVGLGWHLNDGGGFIERKFKPCSEDVGTKGDPLYGGQGPDDPQQHWGGMCWESPDEHDGHGSTNRATNSMMQLSLAGKSTHLIRDATTQKWYTTDDFGWTIEQKSGASNGDENGNYFVITTQDGTTYRLGYYPESNWTTAVIGDDSWGQDPYQDEPCTENYPTPCQKSWRMQLDKVVDPNGNVIDYSWAEQYNWYRSPNSTTANVDYVRGGYLTQIRYGGNQVWLGRFDLAPPGRLEVAPSGLWIYTECVMSA